MVCVLSAACVRVSGRVSACVRARLALSSTAGEGAGRVEGVAVSLGYLLRPDLREFALWPDPEFLLGSWEH